MQKRERKAGKSQLPPKGILLFQKQKIQINGTKYKNIETEVKGTNFFP